MQNLIPVAILMVSFVIRSSTAVIGGARSQSPECGAAAARKRIWSRGLLALSISSFAIFLATKSSHSFCFPCLPSVGTSFADRFFHASTVLTFELCTWMCNLTGKMSLWIHSVLAADARKGEGASMVTQRIPRPPFFTGRLSRVYWMSFMLMLMTSVIHFRCSLSNLRSWGLSLHSDVRSV